MARARSTGSRPCSFSAPAASPRCSSPPRRPKSPASRTSRSGSRCSRASPRSPSSPLRQEWASPNGPTTDEPRPRSLQHARDRRGRVLLPRRDGRAPALPGFALPPARSDQGRQPRPWARRARASATRRNAARRAQARRALGDRAAFERDSRAIDRRRAPSAGRDRMTLFEALDLCLAAIVLGLAAWTIAARETFSAVVGYVAYGLLLAIVWVRLYAPDVALTEAAIGSGVTGVLLVAAAARLGRLPTPDAPAGAGLKIAAGLLSVLVAGALAAAVLYLPDPAPSLAPEADRELAATGLGNAVTAVLIAYRSFDTMLEKVVLVLAVVGVWSVAPERFWGGQPAPLGPAAPDAALVFLARILAPIGVVIGVQMFWVGADEPGGAFQGGAILAAMWIIVMMARLSEAPPVSALWLRLTLIAGPAVFLAAGVTGVALAGAFLAYPAGFAKPLILFIESFMTLTIAATLPMLVAGPPSRAPGRAAPLPGAR